MRHVFAAASGVLLAFGVLSTTVKADDLRQQWAHLNQAKRVQKSCWNAMDVRNWGHAIAYCQAAAEAWATVADDDDGDPQMTPNERNGTRAMEGGFLVIAAQAAISAGLKDEARGFLLSARSVANRLRPGADKRRLLNDIQLRAWVL